MSPYKNITYFKPYEPKVTKMGHNGSKEGTGVSFAFDAGSLLSKASKFGVIIYRNDNEEIKLEFSKSGLFGTIFGLSIQDDDILNSPIFYNFYADDEIILDEYAYEYTGNGEFGVNVEPGVVKSVFKIEIFDDFDDNRPGIPFDSTILYGLNVRSFTIDKSSGVKNKGTFEGIVQKLPYLKDLGITSLVLMPCYEYDECHLIKAFNSAPKTVEEVKAKSEILEDTRVDVWGFTKGRYYAPKASYSAINDPVNSFKNLVTQCHKEGIEVIMQIYFEPSMIESFMVDVLKFWSHVYHIDGFRICGFYINHRALINEPSLKQVKMWFDYLPGECLDGYDYYEKNLATNNGNFKNDLRRFLKSDENLINAILGYQKANPTGCAVINYICDYDGFSLNDLYSYERKHNEYNGEKNADGTNENFSWNCGIEGESRKKSINEIRFKQIKNALAFILLSQGTPYIYSGDEFLNSRGGNNNAYCLDNPDGYITWKNNKSANELRQFCKDLILLRKNNKILHMSSELKNLDYKSFGSPDLSYHGTEAWRPELSYNSRMIGIFLNGEYGTDKNKKLSKSFYIGINMHWENHRLAVPKLKKGYSYKKIIDTANQNNLAKENEIPVAARSIVVYEVSKDE